MLYKYYSIIISLIRTQVINFSRLKKILLFSYRYGLMTPTHWNRLNGFRIQTRTVITVNIVIKKLNKML